MSTSIITDMQLRAKHASLTQVVPLRDGLQPLPVRIVRSQCGGLFALEAVRTGRRADLATDRSDRGAESEAFVKSPTAQTGPGRAVLVVFERGAVHVTARSTGPSALLLPVQFSHCFRVHGTKA